MNKKLFLNLPMLNHKPFTSELSKSTWEAETPRLSNEVKMVDLQE